MRQVQVDEWVMSPYGNRIYAKIRRQIFTGRPEFDSFYIQMTINDRVFTLSGRVSIADSNWVINLFPSKPPVYLDGRSSLHDISSALTGFDLVELSERKPLDALKVR